MPDELHISPLLCTYLYEVNTAKAPFDNAKVRRALSLALDRNIITDKILQQGQTPAYIFTPPFINGAEKMKNPEWASWDQNKRNQEAIKLLKEAGYDKAHPLTFNLLYNTSDNHKNWRLPHNLSGKRICKVLSTSIWKIKSGKPILTLAIKEISKWQEQAGARIIMKQALS